MGHGCLKLGDVYIAACKKDPSGKPLSKCFAKHQSTINEMLKASGADPADMKKMNAARKKCEATACDPEKAKHVASRKQLNLSRSTRKWRRRFISPTRRNLRNFASKLNSVCEVSEPSRAYGEVMC